MGRGEGTRQNITNDTTLHPCPNKEQTRGVQFPHIIQNLYYFIDLHGLSIPPF